MADEKDKTQDVQELSKKDAKLIADGCEAYGIPKEHLFNSRVFDGIATLVTNGGKKVKFKAGQAVEKLKEIQITGINPDWKKKKPITGAAKK